ncbi:TonB-dependent receptor [Neolewinella lacunae]|uniref:TonB-dependent receptor n=1 Tax=Neolewinella lacunae TaxID=1517758 RepID=A0A923T9H1_9BACT|nr:TonB-dependent receptor [Neolewinella lacunae]MBC6995561.1 TonB-dependent receptor [Neolewinella lacunae]MDN3635597.1 TonB-dependent receptor [Neolewinella lacunae]
MARWMFRCFFLALLPAIVWGQGGPVTVSGTVLGEHDLEPLGYATVYAEKSGRGVQADSAGFFRLTGLPVGMETLRFSHLGCDPKSLSFRLQRDTVLTVLLHHHDNYTETATVTARNAATYSEQLDLRATAQLGDALERLTGVSSLRTGTAAAKPIYDGLFGNRLSIQNNGVAQSGQQWGNDHAPEIDSWVAAYIRVVEGVEALRYAGPTVAATVLIEPAPLREDEGAAGKVAYGFQSNGLGHTLNARLSRGGKTAYRLSATGKVRGDQRTPDYFLRNTGRREANAALQLTRFHDARWTSHLYYSIFNAEIGVLRGSHIGNLTDLQLAIDREAPFFTEENFSYDIGSPRQTVSHHLLKAETEFRPNPDNRFNFRYGGQLNDRKEFDVRRGDRDDQAALSLQQWNHLLEGTWHRELGTGRHLDASLQYELTENDNQPGTGILPLIPDYNAQRGSAYLAYHHEKAAFQYHLGLRYDRQAYEAITISRDLPRRIERFDHLFHTLGGSVEARWQLTPRASLRTGVTLRQRAPQINELYSQGLHQGVSGIEEGDATLAPERSLKTTAGLVITTASTTLSANVFVQPIQDFIFLEPQPEFRLTVRGAFPLFLYRAGDALLYGSNLQAYWQPAPRWELDGRLAVVYGTNRSEGRPLVFTPPANLRLAVHFHPGRVAAGWQISLESLLVAEQGRLDPEQDFLPPPPAYALLDLALRRDLALPSNRTLHLRLSAQNLLNTAYRDYLDRQRYFADAPGRNVELQVSYAW